MKLRTSILALLGAIALGSATAQTTREPQTMLGRDMGVLDHCTGNPVIPAYLADATIVYDQTSNRFYAYGTITAADLPYTADGNDPVNARNAPSVFEIRVFK